MNMIEPIEDRLKFKKALSYLWKDFVIRKIRYIKTEHRNIKRIQLQGIDEYGQYYKYVLEDTKEHPIAKDKILNTEYVKQEKGKTVNIEYSYYYGFTDKRSIDNNHKDRYHNKDIYFSYGTNKSSYNSIDFINNNGWFGDELEPFKQLITLPNKGNFICGTVKPNNTNNNTKSSYYYDKWFVCTPQFVCLYNYITESDNTLFNSCLLTQKTYKQFIKDRDTVFFNNIRTLLNTVDCSVFNKKKEDMTIPEQRRELYFSNRELSSNYDFYTDIMIYVTLGHRTPVIIKYNIVNNIVNGYIINHNHHKEKEEEECGDEVIYNHDNNIMKNQRHYYSCARELV